MLGAILGGNRIMNLCENCETEIVDGLGCDCGDYEPGFDKVAYFVEKSTGYKGIRS
jgi:hypothetical protein